MDNDKPGIFILNLYGKSQTMNANAKPGDTKDKPG